METLIDRAPSSVSGVGAAPSIAAALLAGTLELPILPAATAQVLRLTAAAEVDVRALGDAVRSDVALAAHVMRLANTPLYRGREPIVTLAQAALRLGTQRLRDVAVVVASRSRLFTARGFEADARAAFAHGLQTGLWAQEIARLLRSAVEETFLAGLLHDVGTPVLLQAASDRVEDASARRAEVLEAIEALHPTIGADLCVAWQLSERLGTAIRQHHQPLPSPLSSSGALGAMVQLADDIAVAAAAGLDRSTLSTLVRGHPAAAALNLYNDDIDALLLRADVVLATARELA